MARLFRLVVGLGATAAVLVGLGLGAGFFIFLRSLDRAEQRTPRCRRRHRRADRRLRTDCRCSRPAGARPGRRLLITGVNEKTTKEEIARQRPEFRPFFACCVDLDYRALNTIGNAEQTRKWVSQHGFSSLLVVTSTYHMPRTLAELGHALPNVKLVPHPVVPEHLDLDGWWRDPC